LRILELELGPDLGPYLKPESEQDLELDHELELDDGGDLELKYPIGKKEMPTFGVVEYSALVHCYSLKSRAPGVVTVSIDQ
jgi:hypothetical protein